MSKVIQIIGVMGIVISVAFANIYALLGLGFLLLLDALEEIIKAFKR